MNVLKLHIEQFTEAIETLGHAERGRLITAALEYAQTGKEPVLSGSERGTWGTVKAMVDKQTASFARRSKINSRNASIRYESMRIAPKRTIEKEKSPHTPLKEKGSFRGDDNNLSLTRDCSEIIDFLNEVAGTSYKHSETSMKPIRARLNDGFTIEDCKTVIRNRWKAWRGTEYQQYMRPDTLFRPSKFEGYLNSGEPVRKSRNTILNYQESGISHANLGSIAMDPEEL